MDSEGVFYLSEEKLSLSFTYKVNPLSSVLRCILIYAIKIFHSNAHRLPWLWIMRPHWAIKLDKPYPSLSRSACPDTHTCQFTEKPTGSTRGYKKHCWTGKLSLPFVPQHWGLGTYFQSIKLCVNSTGENQHSTYRFSVRIYNCTDRSLDTNFCCRYQN